MYYAFFVIYYNLGQVIVAYQTLMSPSSLSGNNAQIGAIGMQAVGSTCMYIVGLLVGVKILSMVPEVASWLIPGGVSSSAGSAASGVAAAGASMVAGAAGATGGMVVGAATGMAGASISTANKIAEISGTMVHGGANGTGTSFVSAVAQNTSLGKAYNEGRKRGRDGSDSYK